MSVIYEGSICVGNMQQAKQARCCAQAGSCERLGGGGGGEWAVSRVEGS